MRVSSGWLSGLAVLVVAASACSSTPAAESTPNSSDRPATTASTTIRRTPSTTAVVTTTLATEPADLVIWGGPVWTMLGLVEPAEAVAVEANLIRQVGSRAEIEPLVGPETVIVDLAGRALVPGFVDAHSHYYGAALAEGWAPELTQETMLGAGVTTMGEAAVDQTLFAEMQRLDGEGLIQVRSSAYLIAGDACGEDNGRWQFDIPPTRKFGERFRVGGIKVFTDGGSCHAPAVSFEHGFGGHGDLYFTAEQLTELIRPYDEAGYQVIVHALGDRALEATLGGLEAIIGDSGNPLRHRIEHNAVVRPEMRDRYDGVGAVTVIFGSFGTCSYLGRDDRFRFSTPIENQEWEWPWRDLLDLNPNTAFAWHGDFPVFSDSSPIASLSGFVTRSQTLEDGTHCDPEPYHSKHAISVDEALRLMTIGAAYALDRDTEVGSIEAGKLADLVILSDNPFAAAPEKLIDLEVDMTILDGRPVHCGPDFSSYCSGAPVAEAGPTASVSLPSNPPSNAFDGDPETHWGAGADAPQWVEFPFDGERTVALVRLIVDQYPAGNTHHIIWGRRAGREEVMLAEVSLDTENLDVLEIPIENPVPVVAVRVETVESPSWVAWREIEFLP